jgi:cobalt/nickel transport protein
MIIPSTNQVAEENPMVDITLSFSRPFEKIAADLEWPKTVLVVNGDQKQDLKGMLLETNFLDHQAWKLQYQPKLPGIYWFTMESSPQWQQAEDQFIIYFTKTAISVFGGDENWANPIGAQAEILPLLRPYGNYAGNTFTGTVLLDGTTASGVEVEVAHYNEQNWAPASAAHITQVVKTDANGTFIFTCPLPGWWGFMAHVPSDTKIKDQNDDEKPVEVRTTIWVYFDPNPFIEQ